jgi:hypothetical protein
MTAARETKGDTGPTSSNALHLIDGSRRGCIRHPCCGLERAMGSNPHGRRFRAFKTSDLVRLRMPSVISVRILAICGAM